MIILTVQGPCRVHMNFRIDFFSIYIKIAIGILIGIALICIKHFRYYC